MEKITQVTEADVGRIAVSIEGKAKFDFTEEYRVRVVAVPSDPHNTPIEHLREDGSVKHAVPGFALVRGGLDMYWEDEVKGEQKLEKEPKPQVGIWFATAPAVEAYGLEAVKEVIADAFELANRPNSPWKTVEEYFRNWGETITDGSSVIGIDLSGHFDGWDVEGIDGTRDHLISFEDFCERLGLNAPSIAEGGAPALPALTAVVETPTPFRAWCKAKGYDPKGEFVFDKETTVPECINNAFSLDDVLILNHDDGSYCPRFMNQDFIVSYEEFSTVGAVHLKQKSKAKPRFRKPRKKLAVRQKTDVTVIYKTGQKYTIKNVDGIALNEQFISVGVSKEVTKGVRANTTNVLDVDFVKSVVVKTPEGNYALVNYSNGEWLVNSPKGFAICSQWCQSF